MNERLRAWCTIQPNTHTHTLSLCLACCLALPTSLSCMPLAYQLPCGYVWCARVCLPLPSLSFSAYLPRFVDAIWHLLTTASAEPKYDLVSVCFCKCLQMRS
eukprot:Opistho-2@94426